MQVNIFNKLIFAFPVILFVIFSCEENNTLSKKVINFPYLTGKKLPEIEYKNLNGEIELLKHKKSQIIIINSWSTGCGPCIAEISGLNKLVEKYKSQNNIKFIAIANNDSGIVKDFLRYKEFKYEQKIRSVNTKKYIYGAVPRNIVCNKDGIVIYDRYGGCEEMYKEIEAPLKAAIKGESLYFSNFNI